MMENFKTRPCLQGFLILLTLVVGGLLCFRNWRVFLRENQDFWAMQSISNSDGEFLPDESPEQLASLKIKSNLKQRSKVLDSNLLHLNVSVNYENHYETNNSAHDNTLAQSSMTLPSLELGKKPGQVFSRRMLQKYPKKPKPPPPRDDDDWKDKDDDEKESNSNGKENPGEEIVKATQQTDNKNGNETTKDKGEQNTTIMLNNTQTNDNKEQETNQGKNAGQDLNVTTEKSNDNSQDNSGVSTGGIDNIKTGANNTSSNTDGSKMDQPSSSEDSIISSDETIFVPNQEQNEPVDSKSDLDCLSQNLYSFTNGTCTSDCPVDLFVIQADAKVGKLMCIPCDSSCSTCKNQATSCTSCSVDSPYLFKNQSCLSICPSDTYVIVNVNGSKNCLERNSKKSTEDQRTVIQAISNHASVGGTIASISLTYNQMLGCGSSSTASKILLINFIQYIKYININYPPKLASIFENQVQDIVSFEVAPPFPDLDKDEISKYTASYRFSRYKINGLFIVNFWEETITLLIFGLAALLLTYLNKKKLQNPYVSKAIECGKIFFVWNFMIAFLLSNLGEAIIFASVEFSDLNLDSFLAVSSFLFDLFFLIIYFVLQLYIIFKLLAIRRDKERATLDEKVKAHANVRILFENAKNEHFLQEILIAITNYRVVFAGLIIGAMDAPTVQCSLLIVLNIIMVAYLGILRPYRETWKNIELILYELLSLAADIICLKLSLIEPEDQYDDISAETALIVINAILITLVMLFQLLELFLQTRYLVRSFLQKRKSFKVHPQPFEAPVPAPNQPDIEENDVKNVEKNIPKILGLSKENLGSVLTKDLSRGLSLQYSDGSTNSAESTPKSATEAVTLVISANLTKNEQ